MQVDSCTVVAVQLYKLALLLFTSCSFFSVSSVYRTLIVHHTHTLMSSVEFTELCRRT